MTEPTKVETKNHVFTLKHSHGMVVVDVYKRNITFNDEAFHVIQFILKKQDAVSLGVALMNGFNIGDTDSPLVVGPCNGIPLGGPIDVDSYKTNTAIKAPSTEHTD